MFFSIKIVRWYRRVIIVEILICTAYCLNSLLLWDVRVQGLACDIHRYQNSILWHYCLLNEIYKTSCVFGVRFLLHGNRL